MRDEDFSVTFLDGTLSITGARKDPQQKTSFLAMEIPFGAFRIEVQLDPAFEAEPGDITASYHSGFLIVDIPRKQPARVRLDEQ